MKKSYNELIIAKTLADLGVSERLNHDGFVSVRAIKDIAFPYFDLYVPNGTLFFITGLVYDNTCKESCCELQLAFPDTEDIIDAWGLCKYYLPCKIDHDASVVIDSTQNLLAESIEAVDGETEESMRSLYAKWRTFEETACKRGKMYSTIEDIAGGVMLIITAFVILCGGIVWLANSVSTVSLSSWSVFIYATPIFIASLVAFIISHNYNYERTKEGKTRREEMAALCKMIMTKEHS